MTGRTGTQADLFRRLPSVDELLREGELPGLAAREGHGVVVECARGALEGLRKEVAAGTLDETAVEQRVAELPQAVALGVALAVASSLRPVINATGVILHTNLGRAPLADAALEAIRRTAGSYSNLEFDLGTGNRGKRDAHVDGLFRSLLGVSGQRELSTIVVNNNAAAVWLALNSLAAGGEVIVSRGELVEIGGSFRIPDVMAQSNGILREVGTTNRTRIADYERAITDKTRVLLRVHRSNFEITGFTEQPSLEELVSLARQRSIPLVEDLGSGALLDLKTLGVRDEGGVLESLRAGVDVVTYSGDKLLGGPQAGMLSGRRDLIARMRSNSLFRALRADKLVYAALQATLLAYIRGDYNAIPALQMMRLDAETIRTRASALAARLSGLSGLQAEVVAGESVIGGGAAPSSVLSTWVVAIQPKKFGAGELQARLRASGSPVSIPVVARIENDRVVLDVRTVFPPQDQLIVNAFERILASDSNR